MRRLTAQTTAYAFKAKGDRERALAEFHPV
jgi:hypothetical protein